MLTAEKWREKEGQLKWHDRQKWWRSSSFSKQHHTTYIIRLEISYQSGMDGSSDDYINLAKYVVLDKERQGRKGQLVSERFCGILEKNAGKNKD